MDKLFVETDEGKVPVSQEITEKYKLEKGDKTPFTQGVIVDKSGSRNPPRKPEEKHDMNYGHKGKKESGIVQLENGIMLSTSEILDIAQGADSHE